MGNNMPIMSFQHSFEESWTDIQSLSRQFLDNQAHYLSPNYQEAEVRKDFIDKLFSALGWDVDHDVQYDPYRQEVKIERPEKKQKDAQTSLSPLLHIINACAFLWKQSAHSRTL